MGVRVLRVGDVGFESRGVRVMLADVGYHAEVARTGNAGLVNLAGGFYLEGEKPRLTAAVTVRDKMLNRIIFGANRILALLF